MEPTILTQGPTLSPVFSYPSNLTITCNTDYACNYTELYVGLGENVKIDCYDYFSCNFMQIYANHSDTIDINCHGLYSCNNNSVFGQQSNILNLNCYSNYSCNDLIIYAKQTREMTIDCLAHYSCNNLLIYGDNIRTNFKLNCISNHACNYLIIYVNTSQTSNVKCSSYSNKDEAACKSVSLYATNVSSHVSWECFGDFACSHNRLYAQEANDVNVIAYGNRALHYTHIFAQDANQYNLTCISDKIDMLTCFSSTSKAPSKSIVYPYTKKSYLNCYGLGCWAINLDSDSGLDDWVVYFNGCNLCNNTAACLDYWYLTCSDLVTLDDHWKINYYYGDSCKYSTDDCKCSSFIHTSNTNFVTSDNTDQYFCDYMPPSFIQDEQTNPPTIFPTKYPSQEPTSSPTQHPTDQPTSPTPTPTPLCVASLNEFECNCDNGLDLIFVVDSSGSVYDSQYKNWQSELDAMKGIVNASLLNIITHKLRVGLINFSGCSESYTLQQCRDLNRLKKEFGLKTYGSPYNDLQAVYNRIDQMGPDDHNGGYTWTEEALFMALKEFQGNSSSNSAKSIVLITDGEPYPNNQGHEPCKTSTSYTSPTLAALRNLSVRIIAAGIDVSQSTIDDFFKCIVDDFSTQFFYTDDFSSLSSDFVDSVEDNLCPAEPTLPPSTFTNFTSNPTAAPTLSPTELPSQNPSKQPTTEPTPSPSSFPTMTPTDTVHIRDICIWGSSGGINGLYSYNGTYNNAPYYRKPIDPQSCMYSALYIYYHIGFSRWVIADENSVGSDSFAQNHAFCDATSSTNVSCSGNWFVRNGGWEEDSDIYMTNGQCPEWNCNGISVTSSSKYICDGKFDRVQGTPNAYKKQGENYWIYFWPFSFKWICTGELNQTSCSMWYYADGGIGWDNLDPDDPVLDKGYLGLIDCLPFTPDTTLIPTHDPTPKPWVSPTWSPSDAPSPAPSNQPTDSPTPETTSSTTPGLTVPDGSPTRAPTEKPSPEPTTLPTDEPTMIPTAEV